MTRDDTDHDLDDDDEEYVEQEKELIVFERLHNQERVPEGFTAATVLLDARPSSALKWDEALKSAEKLVEQGFRLVFDFDLGLLKPFSHAGQFQACSFALTYFQETVWPLFKEHTSAVILCRSSLAFDKAFLWGQQEIDTLAERNLKDDQLPFFYRDVALEYFTLLAAHLPDECPALLLFDCQEMQTPWLFALLTAQHFPRFRLALKHAPFATDAITWNDSPSTGDYIGRTYVPATPIPAVVGILLPALEQQEKVKKERLKKIIDTLLKTKTPFKIISEEFLTMEWEGLDTIILSHDTPSLPLRRALDGFIAASGNVIFTDASFEKWLQVTDH